MKLFDWLRRRRMRTLIVMRSQDMFVVHPETDFTYTCAQCAAQVGIYPSGQDVIRRFGRERVEIICNQCVDNGLVRRAKLAPGALAERGQSVRKQ